MTSYAKYALYNNMASLIVNILLNLVFIRQFGIVGVALATGISIILNNLISIIEVKILLNVFAYDIRYLAQITFFGVANFALGFILNQWLSVRNTYLHIMIFGAIVYLINAILIAIFYKNDIISTLKGVLQHDKR